MGGAKFIPKKEKKHVYTHKWTNEDDEKEEDMPSSSSYKPNRTVQPAVTARPVGFQAATPRVYWLISEKTSVRNQQFLFFFIICWSSRFTKKQSKAYQRSQRAAWIGRIRRLQTRHRLHSQQLAGRKCISQSQVSQVHHSSVFITDLSIISVRSR